MTSGLPELRSLVRALLHHEKVGEGADASVLAAERVLHRLAERITPLVGTGGFHMLLQRALRRASSPERAWLEVIDLSREAPWHLPGATEAARDRSPADTAPAMEAVVAELLGLIARFLGADMAIRLVRQSFPDVAVGGDTGAGFEETIHE